MIASPSTIDQKQLEELHLNIKIKAEEKEN
jgi:hypothetical protein